MMNRDVLGTKPVTHFWATTKRKYWLLAVQPLFISASRSTASATCSRSGLSCCAAAPEFDDETLLRSSLSVDHVGLGMPPIAGWPIDKTQCHRLSDRTASTRRNKGGRLRLGTLDAGFGFWCCCLLFWLLSGFFGFCL